MIHWIKRSPVLAGIFSIVAILLGLGFVYFNQDRLGFGSLSGNDEELKNLDGFEESLGALAEPKLPVRPGDWLAQNQESGQSFEQYLKDIPVRRGPNQTTIYICEVGEFSPDQARILAVTYEYMEAFFDVPVKVHKRVALSELPDVAQRIHPRWQVHQLEVGYIMEQLLKKERPSDALAYLAFTAHDLWPKTEPGEKPYNFVFGQASLGERVGAWSMNRFGDPSKGEAERLLCLKRTLGTATHETGHILSMQHCTAFNCNMCGANSNEEGDRHPLHFCPVCLRKLIWNLKVEPVAYLKRLETFCEKHALQDEETYYRKAVQALQEKQAPSP